MPPAQDCRVSDRLETEFRNFARQNHGSRGRGVKGIAYAAPSAALDPTMPSLSFALRLGPRALCYLGRVQRA